MVVGAAGLGYNAGGGQCLGGSTGGVNGLAGKVLITWTTSAASNNTLKISNAATSTVIVGGLSVGGTLTKGSGTFVIDDPLDPKNKLLYHSFVESPQATDLYDGLATLDGGGHAMIELPDYFDALNKDFQYLTTAMGQPMPNLYIAQGVHHRYFFGLFGPMVFDINGGAPKGEVSWQVTGVRQDPAALTDPYDSATEVEKGPAQLVDVGQYVCPECYGQPGQ